MRALLDVNVLIALLDASHVHHARARDWLGRHIDAGWASCPLTQNGCLRIMSQPGYPQSSPVHALMSRLRGATSTTHHQFWPDSISLLDAGHANPQRIHGPKQLTDIYLLALAVHHGGRFVTFDSAIVPAAVPGAGAKHLVNP